MREMERPVLDARLGSVNGGISSRTDARQKCAAVEESCRTIPLKREILHSIIDSTLLTPTPEPRFVCGGLDPAVVVHKDRASDFFLITIRGCWRYGIPILIPSNVNVVYYQLVYNEIEAGPIVAWFTGLGRATFKGLFRAFLGAIF